MALTPSQLYAMSVSANSADTLVNALPTRPIEQVENISIKDIAPVEMSPALSKAGDTWLNITLPAKVDPNAAPVLTTEEKTKQTNKILGVVVVVIVIAVIAIAAASRK